MGLTSLRYELTFSENAILWRWSCGYIHSCIIQNLTRLMIPTWNYIGLWLCRWDTGSQTKQAQFAKWKLHAKLCKTLPSSLNAPPRNPRTSLLMKCPRQYLKGIQIWPLSWPTCKGLIARPPSGWPCTRRSTARKENWKACNTLQIPEQKKDK